MPSSGAAQFAAKPSQRKSYNAMPVVDMPAKHLLQAHEDINADIVSNLERWNTPTSVEMRNKAREIHAEITRRLEVADEYESEHGRHLS
jgi:hypothetical protein